MAIDNQKAYAQLDCIVETMIDKIEQADNKPSVDAMGIYCALCYVAAGLHAVAAAIEGNKDASL